MTDIKEAISGLEGYHIGPEILDSIHTCPVGGKCRMYTEAAKKLLNKDVAKLFMTRFLLGSEGIEVYGNPISMAARSDVMASFLEGLIQRKEDSTPHIARNITVMKDIEPLISVWLHMNGIPSDSFFVGFDNCVPLPKYNETVGISTKQDITYSLEGTKTTAVGYPKFISAPSYIPRQLLPEPVMDPDSQRILYLRAKPHPSVTKGLQMWNWIKYFGVDTKEHAFNQYIIWLRDLLWDYVVTFSFISYYFEVLIPEEYLSIMQDLHSKLKILAANDELIHDDNSLNTNMKGLLDFMLMPGLKSLGGYNYNLPENPRCSYFGYDTKEVTEELKKEERIREEREQKLKGIKKLNKEMWEKLGPAPYPKDHEYHWPKFYYESDWRRNTTMWDWSGNPYGRNAVDTVPEGGYHPGTKVPERPYNLDVFDELELLGSRFNVLRPSLLPGLPDVILHQTIDTRSPVMPHSDIPPPSIETYTQPRQIGTSPTESSQSIPAGETIHLQSCPQSTCSSTMESAGSNTSTLL